MKPGAGAATWLLEQESRALLTRLESVKPFVVQETMVPAAALSPAALTGIERYLITGRRRLRREVLDFIEWLRTAGKTTPPEAMQRKFTVLRLKFNTALAQLDLFSEIVTQRSEHETGVWLSGLDVAAAEALGLPAGFEAPPILCHLHRGMGGAIRRARTRLPGGGENPVSIIRIPRERMIGYGIASSLVHEVGHQAAAILGLVESLRAELQRMQQSAPAERASWRYWERTVSETVADFWSIGKVGISSTMGLIAVVSLPRFFVFRVNPEDPHPFPWIRVLLSCAIGEAMFPHPQWKQLAGTWEAMYPPTKLAPAASQLIAGLRATMPRFVKLLLEHRPPSLDGRSLGQLMPLAERTPARLAELHETWKRDRSAMRKARPTLAFAVLGQARALGSITPEREAQLLRELIRHWALESTLQLAERTAAQLAPAARRTVLGQPAIWAGERRLVTT
jgi:hypothetical protein